MERFLKMLCTPRAAAGAGLFWPLARSDCADHQIFQEIFHILPHIFSVSESDMILTLLSLVDMTLVGGLLVMVMFSGYENFVSQLDINEGKENSVGWAKWTRLR